MTVGERLNGLVGIVDLLYEVGNEIEHAKERIYLYAKPEEADGVCEKLFEIQSKVIEAEAMINSLHC